MTATSAPLSRPDSTANVVVAELPPPPRALFAPSENEMMELREQQRQAKEDAGERHRHGRIWSKVRLTAGITGWGFAALGFAAAASMLPLRRDVHHYTVLNDVDHTAAVFRSTWDLPESKRETLILGTAAQYVRACETYSWVEAQSNYNYCAGLSYGNRLKEFVEASNPDNNGSPQAVLGRDGWKRVVTGRPIRTGDNGVAVPFTVVVAKPNETPVCARRIMRLSYLPVQSLPTTLHLQYPTADLVVFSASVDQDPTPIDANACRV